MQLQSELDPCMTGHLTSWRLAAVQAAQLPASMTGKQSNYTVLHQDCAAWQDCNPQMHNAS